MLSIKDNQVYNSRDELIGCFCHNQGVLVYVAEAYIHQYSLKDLRLLAKHMYSQRGKDGVKRHG